MACACGAGVNSARLLVMGGLPATAQITHTLLLGIGAVLVVNGLWKIRRASAQLAIVAFVALAAAAVFTPPSVMTAAHEPWATPQVVGAALYIGFAGLLARAFWLAFPFPQPGAAATAFGGTALATGCNCCMVTGAVAGLWVTAGGNASLVLRHPLVFSAGIAITALGLLRIAGFRPLPWLASGAVVTLYGGSALQLLGDFMVGDVNLRFVPGYAAYLAGAGLIVKAWAVAYATVRAREQEPVLSPPPAPVYSV